MHNPSRLYTLALMLAALAFMLLGHPYEGVYHDGVLYFGQALLNAGAPALNHDVFFVGGSQDRYSIYGPLMAALYEHLGRPLTQVGVLLTSWLLMLGAVFALLRRFEPNGSIWLWGGLAFAVLSPIYGGCWILAYTETFVTARSVAEPPLLWSLVALLSGRVRLAMALQLLAALFHPLLSLPVMALTWCFLASKDRRWLWLLAVIPAVLGAAAAGIPPWDGLLKTYPPYWGALVQTANQLVQLGNWPLRDHLIVLQDLIILLAVIRLRPADDCTRLLWAVIFATVALMGLTALGADLLHSILLTQLQLWRVHLVSHLLAMALVPWLALRLWQRGGLWPVSVCALALTLTNAHIGTNHGVATLSLWALTSLIAWRVQSVAQAVRVLACCCILACALMLSADQLIGAMQQMTWQSPKAGWGDRFAKLAAFPALALIGFALLWQLAGKARWGAPAAFGLSVLLLGTAAWNWDRRTDLARAIDEAPTAPTHPFVAHLPVNATVYWPTELAAVWGLLERASHYSQPQGAGLLFNRDTALVFGARKEMYLRINEDREQCKAGSLITRDLSSYRACDVPAIERLTTLCGQPAAPDFIVLRNQLAAKPLSTWHLPAHREPPQTYALYACTQFKPAEAL
jgi:hypothetical protein